jgi:hypothetical protein
MIAIRFDFPEPFGPIRILSGFSSRLVSRKERMFVKAKELMNMR